MKPTWLSEGSRLTGRAAADVTKWHLCTHNAGLAGRQLRANGHLALLFAAVAARLTLRGAGTLFHLMPGRSQPAEVVTAYACSTIGLQLPLQLLISSTQAANTLLCKTSMCYPCHTATFAATQYEVPVFRWCTALRALAASTLPPHTLLYTT